MSLHRSGLRDARLVPLALSPLARHFDSLRFVQRIAHVQLTDIADCWTDLQLQPWLRMSSPLQIGKGVSTSSTSASPTQQSPVVASSSTTDTPPPPPPLPPLFLASQSGDLNALHQLLPPRNDSDEATTSTGVSANDRDPQGITALHWAAINNHLLACKLLLERGAEVDAVGGDLMATPLHWAAR